MKAMTAAPMLLCLDLATRVGWAHGRVGERPVWGANDLGRGRSNGEVLSAYISWLCARLDALQPEVVAFESPYMPAANSRFSAPANALTIRRLYSLAGFTEAICHRRRLRCYEAAPSEITRAFLGGPAPKGRANKKAATIKMARLLGYPVADDDEADAVALWTFAEGIFAPQMISERRAAAGIELALHGSKTRSAPRGDHPRSAQTIFDRGCENDRVAAEDNSASRQLQFTQDNHAEQNAG